MYGTLAVAENPFQEAWSKIESGIARRSVGVSAWEPQEGPQISYKNSNAYELFYGGAAGGGKTYGLAHDGVEYAAQGGVALFLRRTYPELREVIDMVMPTIHRLGGVWNEQQKRATFPGGGALYFGYCAKYADVLQYQGRQFGWIGFDELGQIPEERIWTYLISRNRAGLLPKKMRATGNPGGAGHHWIKRRFISCCKADGTPYEYELHGHKMTRAFIQAFLTDNVKLLEADPGYEARLDMLPEVEREWLKFGNWSAGAGMGLSDFNRDRHTIAPFTIPSHWTLFGGFDWGFNHPFSFGLYAADEDGNVYLIETVRGRRLQPAQILHRIDEVLKDRGYDVRKLSQIDAGHDCWAEVKARGENVPTIAEQFWEMGVLLHRANISRIAGVQNMRRYLTWKLPSGEEITPRFRIFRTTSNMKLAECLESRVSDPDNIEDILKTDADENGEGGDDDYDSAGSAKRVARDVHPLIRRSRC